VLFLSFDEKSRIRRMRSLHHFSPWPTNLGVKGHWDCRLLSLDIACDNQLLMNVFSSQVFRHSSHLALHMKQHHSLETPEPDSGSNRGESRLFTVLSGTWPSHFTNILSLRVVRPVGVGNYVRSSFSQRVLVDASWLDLYLLLVISQSIILN